ncbi:MAG: N-acetylmuramoyl-L-alanine amidase [Chloroflexota bacterium]
MSQVLRLSRRRFLALLAALPFAAGLAGGKEQVLALARPAVKGGAEIRSRNLDVAVEDLMAEFADGVQVASGQLRNVPGRSGLALSRAIAAPFPFYAVAAQWLGEPDATVALRTSADGVGWSDWRTVGREMGRDTADGINHSTLVFVSGDGRHGVVQARLVVSPEGKPDAQLNSFRLTFIDPGHTQAVAQEQSIFGTVAAASEVMAADKPAIISRSSWGCPNPAGDMRDGSGNLLWPKEYYTASHLILHHTDTSNTATDWPAVVRVIWNYHAVTLGWGDVGYNMMIDPTGQIYEGRAGANDAGHVDDDVEAGHVYSYNRHTSGIAIIGTYATEAPPAVALAACERLMAWKCSQRGLDPQGNGYIQRGCDGAWILMPRIAGHTDYGWYDPAVCPGSPKPNSSCPGASLEAKLPEIRQQAAAVLAPPKAEVTSVSISPTLVQVGSTLRATVTVRNAGSTVLRGGSPNTSYVYAEGQVAGTGDGVLRVGLDYEGRPSSQPRYPYRWGLGADLAPGESRQVTVSVQLNAETTRKYWLGVIYERDQVLVDHVGETTVNARQKRFGGDVGIDRVQIGPTIVFTNSVLKVTAEVQNWGTTAAATEGQPPGYVYEAQAVVQDCPPDQYGAYRIGVDYQGRSEARDHPYRWGLGSSLPPGAVRQITGYIRLRTPSAARSYWVGFVREGVAWTQDNVATVSATVQVPKSRSFFPRVLR